MSEEITPVGSVAPVFLDPPAEPEPQPLDPFEFSGQSARDAFLRDIYQQEADPLFFKWQRGEATEQDWLDKVREIKDRFPPSIN